MGERAGEGSRLQPCVSSVAGSGHLLCTLMGISAWEPHCGRKRTGSLSLCRLRKNPQTSAATGLIGLSFDSFDILIKAYCADTVPEAREAMVRGIKKKKKKKQPSLSETLMYEKWILPDTCISSLDT